jgi:hypothetical protein
MWDEPVEEQYIARSHGYDVRFDARQRLVRDPEVPIVANLMGARGIP